MLRRLQAARRLGGLVAALPRAAEPLDALCAVHGAPLWRAAAAQEAPSSKGCGRSTVTRPLGAARGFCAAAGSGDQPAEPPAPGAAPPERESTAARGDADAVARSAPPDASAARAPTRRNKKPRVDVKNEKTASGRPKPDVRTVARLVELGWCDTAEAAEAALTRRELYVRFEFETAAPAIDWLINTLGDEKRSNGRCRAAHAVSKFPRILSCSTSVLQQGWEIVVLPREAGGVGLSEEVARRRVALFPQVLIKVKSKESLQKRAAFLETLGFVDGRAAIAKELCLLGPAEDLLRSNAEWLRSQGLDLKRIFSAQHEALILSAQSLSPRLEFLRGVVGLGSKDIGPLFLSFSLQSRMRPRWFYAMQRGVEQRYTIRTLIGRSDAAYVNLVNGLPKGATTEAEVAAYKAYIASPAFRAYMDEQEHNIRARLADT